MRDTWLAIQPPGAQHVTHLVHLAHLASRRVDVAADGSHLGLADNGVTVTATRVRNDVKLVTVTSRKRPALMPVEIQIDASSASIAMVLVRCRAS